MLNYQTDSIKYYASGRTHILPYFNSYIRDRSMYKAGFKAIHRKARLAARVDQYMVDAFRRLRNGCIRRGCTPEAAFVDALDITIESDHKATPEVIAGWLKDKNLKRKGLQ